MSAGVDRIVRADQLLSELQQLAHGAGFPGRLWWSACPMECSEKLELECAPWRTVERSISDESVAAYGPRDPARMAVVAMLQDLERQRAAAQIVAHRSLEPLISMTRPSLLARSVQALWGRDVRVTVIQGPPAIGDVIEIQIQVAEAQIRRWDHCFDLNLIRADRPLAGAPVMVERELSRIAEQFARALDPRQSSPAQRDRIWAPQIEVEAPAEIAYRAAWPLVSVPTDGRTAMPFDSSFMARLGAAFARAAPGARRAAGALHELGRQDLERALERAFGLHLDSLREHVAESRSDRPAPLAPPNPDKLPFYRPS